MGSQVSTREDIGSTLRLQNLSNVLGVAQPTSLQMSVIEVPHTKAQEEATLQVE